MGLNLGRRFSAWRHGRGFGIHSPFAFDFITRTLRERLPYYGYDAIDAALASHKGATKLSARRLRLIFRIAVRYNPSTVAIIGDGNDKVLSATLKAVRSDVKIVDKPEDADFIIVTDCSAVNLRRENAVILFPDIRQCGSSAIDHVWSQVTRGMRFDSSTGFTAIVADPRLPRQQFNARF